MNERIIINLPKVFNTRHRWFDNIILAKALEIVMKDDDEEGTAK